MRTQVRARIPCPHGRHSTWRSKDRRAATHNVNVQHRRSSPIKTVALATSITQKLHAFAHLFPLASMHLANPPQPFGNGQRSSGNVILRAVHFYRVYLMYLIKMHPQVCGLWGLLVGKCFFRCSSPCLRPLHMHRFGGFSGTGMKIFLYKP